MQRVKRGFNQLAPFYIFISRLVFGHNLQKAQHHFLNSIKPADTVLILGGGSGDLLKSLLNAYPHITVDYIDISLAMIALAKKKNHDPSTVNFIVGTEVNIPNRLYSVVITNFYLDLFSDKTLEDVIQLIKPHVSPDGQWLVTDFISKKFWHRAMLWIMYRFFRITTGIEARKLPDWECLLSHAGLKEIESKNFYQGFIKSSRYAV